MDTVNLRRVRKQLFDIYQNFTDFIYQDDDEKEVVLVKRKEGWIQFGQCKEYGIPVTIIFDKQKYLIPYEYPARLTVMFGSVCIFDAQITTVEKISMDVIRKECLEKESRLNAIQSCIHYATFIKAELYEGNLRQMKYDALCSITSRLRRDYITHMGNEIIAASENNPSLKDELRGLGLFSVEDFLNRTLEFIEKKYAKIFPET